MNTSIILLKIHVICGYVSLFVGAFILVTPKGNHAHRTMGWSYSLVGAILVISAILLLIDLALHKEYLAFSLQTLERVGRISAYQFIPFQEHLYHSVFFFQEYVAFIAFAAITAYLLFSGLRAHSYLKVNTNFIFDKIACYLMLLFFIFIFISMLGSSFFNNPIPFKQYLFVSLFTLPFIIDVLLDHHRFRQHKEDRRRYNVQVIHLRKMIFSYAAIVTAFVVRLSVGKSNRLLHFTPIIIAFLLILYFRQRYRNKKAIKKH